MTRWIAAGVCALAVAGEAETAERELSTDRPDRTESAYTVPSRRWQVEMDVVGWTRDHEPGAAFDAVNVATINLKRGIHPRADLQVVLAPWNGTRVDEDTLVRRRSGFGDVTARLKLNLWGNDGGRTALAVMPFVRLPTAAEGMGESEGGTGLIVPLALELPGGWGAGLMGQVDLRDPGERIVSATVSHAIAGGLGGYVEVFAARSTRLDPDLLSEEVFWTGTWDAGLTWGVTPDVQLDGGANLGLTDDVEDFTLFLGLAVRR